MKLFMIFISVIGLALTIMPAVLVFAGGMSSDLNKSLMLAGTVLWFFSSPFWMNKKEEEKEEVLG